MFNAKDGWTFLKVDDERAEQKQVDTYKYFLVCLFFLPRGGRTYISLSVSDVHSLESDPPLLLQQYKTFGIYKFKKKSLRPHLTLGFQTENC